jgi:site-specific DNA-methyltransferase (adenine-specific)/adenine-specific DNA-methyltransferase
MECCGLTQPSRNLPLGRQTALRARGILLITAAMPTLDWIGKQAVLNHHNEVPYRLIHCNGEHSVGAVGEGNLLVEGDNLHALKALLPYYAKKVKCIYIDPPYNTGNEDWVYNDNVNAPEIRKWLDETVGKVAEDFSRHDKWLCMMYPRLQLLHQLLRDDGAIFISIDDNEVAQLRAVMDDIFGERNFVATIVWQNVYTVKNSTKYLSDMHDYVLLYAKNKESWQRNLRPRDEDTDEDYDNPDEDPKGSWISHALQSRNYYSKGQYKIKCPGGRVIEGPPAGTYWRMSENNFWKADRDKKVWWGKDGNSVPRIKEHLEDAKEGVVPSTWWSHRYAGSNSSAKVALRRILGDREMFVTPKPIQLVRRILELATDKNSLILDSFAGSGATGHAVLEQNSEDGGNRRFILAQLPHETKEQQEKGFNICDQITAERLRRVIHGYSYKDNKGRTRAVNGLPGAFRYCSLGEPLFDEDGRIRKTVKFSDLAHHIFFTETGEPLPKRVTERKPFIGEWNGTALYLLWDSENGGHVLNTKALRKLPKHDGPKVVYADGCSLSRVRLKRVGVTFKQIPYEVKVR